MPCTSGPRVPAPSAATLERMFNPRRIKHCRACGSPVDYQQPPDDNRDRAMCPACGEIHYENPLNVVGTCLLYTSRCV